MKYRDPQTGEFKDITVKVADTLPVGTIVDYDGATVPNGWELVDGSGTYKKIKKTATITATNGNIVDSLAGSSTTDAPSVNAVNNKFNTFINDNIEFKNLTFSDEYVYSSESDLNYVCFKIGKLVCVNINTIAFKTSIPNEALIISGLPIAKIPYLTFPILGARGAETNSARVIMNELGELHIHYGSPSQYGDSANKQYTCTFFYETVD